MADDEKFNESCEKDETEPEPLGNPAPPPDVDMDLLRGDRIGDTVYSGKWCIQTVMKLLQSNVVAKSAEGEDKTEVIDMEEDLQNEVGVLWDMTINVEVCQYLQSVGAIESIYHVITNSKCPRATEMCVGMLANMVSHEELWQSLHSDETLFDVLIPLLSHTDQPLLLELSRFFNTALNHQENRCCYGSLWENGQLVSQELLRILSGSTNSDLLRQVSEMTYILMSLDENDSRFNTLFADVDFVTGVLEASKEFGYRQESTGQLRVIDILHCFTTYEAGIAAIEPCMEQIMAGVVRYLKTLCQSLSLSSSCDVITVIIRILNHIFCRSLAVRIEVMSSSSLVHCLLKTLVSVYRRLGMYNAIAHTPSSKSHKKHAKMSEDQLSSKLSAISSPSWEHLSSEDRKKSRETKASWSERAGLGDATGQSDRTPDASPQPAHHQLKELELSWSERRVASPFGQAVSSSQGDDDWKRPAERRKKIKKKGHSKEQADVREARGNVEEEGRGLGEGGPKHKDVSGDGNEREKADGDKDEASPGGSSGEEDEGSSCMKEESSSHQSLSQSKDEQSCGNVDKRLCSTDSSLSEGFEPSMESTTNDGTEAMDFDSTTFNNEDGHSQSCKNDESEASKDNKTCSDEQDAKQTHGNSDFESNHTEGGGDGYVLNGDAKDFSRDTSVVSGDRYQTLLDVLSEFLADFFNNIRESLTTDKGLPVLSETMKFLNTQCSSTYIRALAMCLSPDANRTSEPLSRLLHLATHLKASHLHQILSESSSSIGNQR